MVAVIISLMLSAAAVCFFAADRKGKFNKEYFGTGVVYLILSIVQCLAAGISTIVLLGTGGDGFMENVSMNNVLYEILCIVISAVGTIVSIVGAVCFINGNRKSNYSDIHLKLSMMSAALAIPVGLAALVAAGIAAYHILGALAVGFAAVFIISLLVFCLGFIFVILLVPFFMMYIGVGLALMYLPQLIVMAIAAACFGILYLIAAYGGISTAVSLCKSGEISKKRAVLYIVLSLFVFTDLYALSKMKKS